MDGNGNKEQLDHIFTQLDRLLRPLDLGQDQEAQVLLKDKVEVDKSNFKN